MNNTLDMTDNINNITNEELAAFLEGSLPEMREKEVSEAIDNSKELQTIIEAMIDIDAMLLFDEIRETMGSRQSDKSSSSMAIPIGESGSSSKWSKHLSRSGKTNDTTSWKEEEYRRAADKGEKKQLRMKNRKTGEAGEEKHSFWGELIIGIIVAIIIMFLRTIIWK